MALLPGRNDYVYEIRRYRNPENDHLAEVTVVARDGWDLSVEGNLYVEVSIELMDQLLRASGFTAEKG